MGIYIPNMEMPKNCGDCRLRMAVGCCGNLPHNTRMPNCHLVEVHTPHGRLIEADELTRHEFNGMQADKKISYQMGWNDALMVVAENAPTIIPAEEGER